MLQYCCTVLPQQFKNSLTIPGEVLILAKDLRDVQLESGVLLQYIDDILITSSTCKDCLLNTITVLNHLAKRGYKVYILNNRLLFLPTKLCLQSFC